MLGSYDWDFDEVITEAESHNYDIDEMMATAANERHRPWTDESVWEAIANGYGDNQIYTLMGGSPGTVKKLRRYYLMAVVEQIHSVVLRDGRVIHLSEKQAKQLNMIILVSRMDKKVLIKGQGGAFKLSDIVTDPEEISRITQVEFDLGKIERPKIQRDTDS